MATQRHVIPAMRKGQLLSAGTIDLGNRRGRPMFPYHEGGDAEFSNQNGIYDKTHVTARLKIEKTIATTRRFGTHGFTTADLF
jgi:hypothetical protein